MTQLNGANYVTTDGRVETYKVVASGIAVTASGVLLQIQGSATKDVRIKRIFCTGILTTAAMVLIQAQRTTAAGTTVAGAVTVTPRLMDSQNSAATAVATSWTSATLGTGNVLLASGRGFYSPATALSTGVEFTFGNRNSQSLVLTGIAEFLHVTVAASGYTGALFDIDVEFTEEPFNP